MLRGGVDLISLPTAARCSAAHLIFAAHLLPRTRAWPHVRLTTVPTPPL